MSRHGHLDLRDGVPPRSRYHGHGRFGRLFPSLPPFAADTASVRGMLMELGAPGGPMQSPDAGEEGDNPAIAAGYTFLGQFLDHDITFDPTSSLERQVDPESLSSYRTPAFELDSVYGAGPAASPHLYDRHRPGRLLLDAGFEHDVPRNSQGTALVGDPRNDENLVVSQLHLAFVKLHDAVLDHVQSSGIRDPAIAFETARRLVRWHYQWVIVHDYLPRIVGWDLVRQALRQRRFYVWRHEPFIPIELSTAAFRFGHSQVRPGYTANDGFGGPIFDASLDPATPDPDDLRGGKRAPRRFVQWRHFFDLGARPQPSRRIDTLLSSPLFTLPFIPPDVPHEPRSLAQRNLLRQVSFGLPSGQSVARRMLDRPLDDDDLADLPPELRSSTPLWFYVLREAQVRCGGERLGPTGGRIVAEVFIGLLQGDPLSYLHQDPRWVPTLPPGRAFAMPDLLRFAGVAEDPRSAD
jgi:hypothetical protein